MQDNDRSIREIFEKEGFYILRGAIKPELADSIISDFESFDSKDGYIGLLKRKPFLATKESINEEKFRFKDLYINNKNVRQAVFNELIINILNLLMSGPVMAFQGLGFKRSTGLRIHRDSNYVSIKSDSPKVIACWIALEDINEGSGALRYYPKSHLLERYRFKDGNDHWVRSHHGIFANNECHLWNEAQMSIGNMQPVPFFAKKGDCIFWDFDLMHEATLTANNKTRYSLITHFCIASQTPMYLVSNKHTRAIEYSKKCFFSSNHYLLKDIKEYQELDSIVAKPIFT